MAVYVIGDVQGCYRQLLQLEEALDFSPRRDHLVFAGDLVNRGPESLDTLRHIMGLGPAASTVLGNHDLHLLAVWRGLREMRRRDTLAPLLAARDADDLLEWLRHQPLFIQRTGYAVVHAGVHPAWTLQDAARLAAEAESLLQGGHVEDALRHMFANEPAVWSEDLQGWERLRMVVNVLTRMRYVTVDGRLDFHEKGAPGTQPEGLLPWLDVPGRAASGDTLIFGHWSTLGAVQRHGCYGIDTGCLWGGQLTALCMEGGEQRLISV
ncbi:MAG: bis(5-nucleosyl)-tetraphosphatase, symmetrical [Pseudomonadota bacterium]|jgi:bis(5'-nucleosyl)-tetraphosphatase (symmetrical)